MTPADRDALVARAKALCVPVANCVAAGVAPSHLIGDASWHELYALVLVLADAADPRALRAVAASAEDGDDVTPEDVRLRAAHAEAQRLRTARLPVPLLLRVADNEYHARLKAARGKTAAALSRDEDAA